MDSGLNALKRFEYTDILGWSVSRYDKFLACKRQYYYDYYGKYDTEFPTSEIALLKSLTSVPLETGNIVHDVIKTLLERLLKSEQAIDAARFTEYAKKMTREYCAKKTFSETYYNQASIDPDSLFFNVQRYLDNLMTSERYRWITRQAITNKKGWVIEPPGYGETRIRGMKAYCKVDFLFPVDRALYILDWKTGKKDEVKHRKQLVGYATWASYHFDKSPESIFPITVYLSPQYSEMDIKVSQADLDAFVVSVESETAAMYAFCSNRERNIPKEKKEFTQTEKTGICRFCNYKKLCGR